MIWFINSPLFLACVWDRVLRSTRSPSPQWCVAYDVSVLVFIFIYLHVTKIVWWKGYDNLLIANLDMDRVDFTSIRSGVWFNIIWWSPPCFLLSGKALLCCVLLKYIIKLSLKRHAYINTNTTFKFDIIFQTCSTNKTCILICSRIKTSL